MTQGASYLIKDTQGNLYGPATVSTIRDWAAEGRISATMQMAPEGSTQWMPIGNHPELADLFVTGPISTSPPPSPQMGTTVPTPSAATGYPASLVPRQRDSLALASLICSLVGLAMATPCLCIILPRVPPILGCSCILAGPLAIVGIVLGAVALPRLRKDSHRAGAGMAKAAIILGIIALLIMMLSVILTATLRREEFRQAIEQAQRQAI